MDIADLLSLEGIVANLKATSKKQVFQELAARAATLSGADPRHIFDVLLERERLGTTGIGRGIAIPHSKVTGIETLYGCSRASSTRSTLRRSTSSRSISCSCCSHRNRRVPSTSRFSPGYRACCATR